MCPACLATVAWITAGTASTGGLAAYLFRKIRRKSGAKDPAERVVSEEEWLKARRSFLAKERPIPGSAR